MYNVSMPKTVTYEMSSWYVLQHKEVMELEERHQNMKITVSEKYISSEEVDDTKAFGGKNMLIMFQIDGITNKKYCQYVIGNLFV